ncbi:DMT family transporter [Streptomyces sp. NPDC048290]|uniref:DMT family transporter n=1 Tax=Streptomyces sp. NPDC048290 TaxID=3155811 RepID=UPI00343DB7E5
MSALAFSVLLSLVSAVAYAGGAIVQERVAEAGPASAGQQFAPLRRPAWWFAVGLNGLGGLLHVIALAYGPLSVVQPLGALTIVFALPMAAMFVGRRAGATAWRGALMATLGLAGLLSLVGSAGSRSLSDDQQIAAFTATVVVVAGLMAAARASARHPMARSVLLALGSGIAFGMSSVFTKTVAVEWAGGPALTELPALSAIGVLAVAGLLLSQASYRGAGLAAPLATLTVVNPVVAAAVGITMFGETFRYGSTGAAVALGCGVAAAGGLILLTTERVQRTAQLSPDTAEPVTPQGPDIGAQRLAVRAGDALEEALDAFVPGPSPDGDGRIDGFGGPVRASRTAAPGAPRKPVTSSFPAAPAARAVPDRPAGPVSRPAPVYGGPFMPLPLLDRHRTRVRS